MGLAAVKLDERYISHLTPLNSLSSAALEEVIANSTVERLPPGRRLFSQRDADNKTIFLLSGQLVLVGDNQNAVTLKAETFEATQPVAAQQPRPVTALAGSSVTILSIETKLLDQIIDNEHRQAMAPATQKEVGSTDHRQMLMRLPLFQNLPEPHQRVLMQRMLEVNAKQGDVIAREGDPGDYYYIVVNGSCRVSTNDNDADIELTAGSDFGVSALIVDGVYSETLTMLQDSCLLRLSRGEFITLLVRPFVQSIDEGAVYELMQQGAVLLDIRAAATFKRQHFPGSINLPFNLLRKIVDILDKDKTYLLYGFHGRRTAMAAFILAQTGVHVSVIGGDKKSRYLSENINKK